ncbi:MAG: phosphatidate cytidylyltransferase [Candidatus Aminicenantes bacterium]|nr:phosphatidate cytidylyltransferase [Candidatus Aminicenantes bacterium]
MKEFLTRTATSIFLVLFVYFGVVYLPHIYFSIFLFIIVSVSVYEFIKLTEPGTKSLILIFFNGLVVAAFFTFGIPELPFMIFINLFSIGLFFLIAIKKEDQLKSFVRDSGIHFLSIYYLFFPLYFILRLREIGPNFLIFLIFVIAIGDSGAYFIGRAIGKHKIYPVASPNKSLEGIIAAVLTAGLSGWLSILIFPIKINSLTAILTGALIGLISQISDPVESLFKRSAGKKDSGSILPGHGGFLDRIDSYIFCAPSLYFIILYIWKTM